MTTYISMLRGINVSGQKTIKMQELKGVYESLGFSDVSTYIQSGNVVFESKIKDSSAVGAQIVKSIENKYGYTVAVVIRQTDELASIIKKNPFIGRRGIKEIKLHVTFLQEKPDTALVKALAPLTAKSTDEYKVVGTEAYLHCPNGYGKTLLSNAFFEKHLNVVATTRNWMTVNTLHSIAGTRAN